MTPRRTTRLTLALALGSTLGVAACGGGTLGTSSSEEATGPVKIGLLVPQSGVYKSLGDDIPASGLHIVVGDDPAGAIDGRAREFGSCVVCMSTRGRGRVAGTMVGSVARAELAQSQSPVVLVGPQADRPPSLVGRPQRRRPSNWPAPLSVKRLVACVEGQEHLTPADQVARIMDTVQSFASGARQFDDITALVLSYSSGSRS